MRQSVSIDEYLQNVARFAGSDYGKLVREQFNDDSGDMELAMLVAPSIEELEEFKRAVAIMTPEEKANCEKLSDEQVQRIAADAHVDPANLAILINGYILHCKRVS